MRRWLAAIFCTAALAGCSTALPKGVDGSLTDDWRLPPAAVAWQPVNEKCFDDVTQTTSQDDYAPLNCGDRHLTETYAVGTLPAAKTTAQAARDAAYLLCAKRADAYVGGSWRASRLTLQPVLPTASAWESGARWYRCDLIETDYTGQVVGREHSLLGALQHETALSLRCVDPTISGENVKSMKAVDCGKAHHAEFAGLWTAPKMPLTGLEGSPQLAKGCLSVIAKYAGVPNDSMIKYRTGWLGFPFSAPAWNAGDRTVQCYLWLSGETMKGSYKGAGTSKLRVHYA